MKYEDSLRRINFEFSEHRTDGYGDLVDMYQLTIDGRAIGGVMTWDKATRTRAWLGTALQDLEALFRAPASSDAASSDTH